MERINKLINDRLTLENNDNNNINIMSQINSDLNKTSVSNNYPQLKIKSIPYYKYSDILPKSNLNLSSQIPENPYRRQLIMAKIIISELQDNISNILLEKQQIENQLTDALNSIKSLHNDYISLTEKFSLVNNNMNLLNNNQNENKDNEETISNLENNIKNLEKLNSDLKSERKSLEEKIKTSEEMNKIQEEKFNYKIILLNKKIETLEYELKSNKESFDINDIKEENKKLKKENISLREDNIELNNRYTNDKKKLILDIEKFKSKINLLESQNVNITADLKEKTILLEKEQRINEQYNTLDKHFNNSLQEKNISYNNLNEQYLKLIQEFNEYKEKTEKNMNDSRIKIDELNKELNDAYELNDEYKNKINAYKNKIKELNEDKKNYDNELDINYKGNSFKRRSQNNNPNKENDIKSNILSNENDKKINNNSGLEEKLYFSEKQKDYILSLLLKITPNKKLIQEIIDLNLEILQMEKQKENIVKKMKENPYLKNILPKIDEQINNFREQLLSLEDELISVDFGSSRIYENSIQN
jgi:hypothetical protein